MSHNHVMSQKSFKIKCLFAYSSSCCSKLPSVIEPHFLSAPCQRTKTNVGLGLKKGWGVVFEKHLFNGWVHVKHINVCWFFFQILYVLRIKRRTLRWTGVTVKKKIVCLVLRICCVCSVLTVWKFIFCSVRKQLSYFAHMTCGTTLV